jgi:hypothetical protein
MPVYLTQWRDGDVTLVFANSLDEAMKLFDQTACLDPVDVVELETPHLTVTLSLAPSGKLTLPEYTPAIEEAKRVCFPRVIEALEGLHPDVVTDPAHVERVRRIVDHETKMRRMSKLSRRLRSDAEK